MYTLSYYIQFFCTVFCFSVSLIGVLNNDEIRLYDNNLHKLLFSGILTVTFVSIFIYSISKFKSGKNKEDYHRIDIERKLLLDHNTEIKEADMRNRSRTDSVVPLVKKKFKIEQMSEVSRQVMIDLNKILSHIIERCDEMILESKDEGEKISTGTLIRIFMFLKTKIVKLNESFEKMLESGNLDQEKIWSEIDLDELAIDSINVTVLNEVDE